MEPRPRLQIRMPGAHSPGTSCKKERMMTNNKINKQAVDNVLYSVHCTLWWNPAVYSITVLVQPLPGYSITWILDLCS